MIDLAGMLPMPDPKHVLVMSALYSPTFELLLLFLIDKQAINTYDVGYFE